MYVVHAIHFNLQVYISHLPQLVVDTLSIKFVIVLNILEEAMIRCILMWSSYIYDLNVTVIDTDVSC